jgi:uncharacterized membrane protein (UPF0127 family)
MKKIKRYKIAFIIPVLVFFAASCNQQTPAADFPYKTGVVSISGHELKVQYADTTDEQQRGLGDRANLAQDQGMYFRFNQTAKEVVWMKNMQFPIDVIWINNSKVVQIDQNLLPQPNTADTQLRLYPSNAEVDAFLETNVGWAADNGIRVGDEVVSK